MKKLLLAFLLILGFDVQASKWNYLWYAPAALSAVMAHKAPDSYVARECVKLSMLCAFVATAGVVIKKINSAKRIELKIEQPENKQKETEDNEQSDDSLCFVQDDYEPMVNIPCNIITPIPVLLQNSAERFNLDGKNLEQDGYGNLTAQAWKYVREEETNNCAYHVLKNLELMLDCFRDFSLVSAARRIELLQNSQNFSAGIHNTLNDRNQLILKLNRWVPKILEKRTQVLARGLNLQHLTLPEVQTEIVNCLNKQKSAKKDFKDLLLNNDKNKAWFVNTNDGHIKTYELCSDEILHLIDYEQDLYKNNIVVLEYNTNHGINGSLMLGNTQDRINQFKCNDNDVLGIVWGEQDLNHWIGYFAIKHEKRIAILEMNSLNDEIHQAKNSKLLFNYLKS